MARQGPSSAKNFLLSRSPSLKNGAKGGRRSLLCGGGPDTGRLDSRLLCPEDPHLTEALGGARRQRRATRLRLVSVFRQGWNAILVALLNSRPLPRGRFVPEPWPNAEDKELKPPVIHEVSLAA